MRSTGRRAPEMKYPGSMRKSSWMRPKEKCEVCMRESCLALGYIGHMERMDGRLFEKLNSYNVHYVK